MLIRYYGHVGCPSGYGTAANELCMAILAAGFELEISTNGTLLSADYLPLASRIRDRTELSPPDVVIVHTLPLDCARVLEVDAIRKSFPKAVCIAYTTWEGQSHIPEAVANALSGFDRVWVPSNLNWYAVYNGLRISVGKRQVSVVPHPFDERRAPWEPRGGRVSEPVPELYRFYYVGAWTARKNVDGLVRAYVREFRPDDPVELVIQSDGAHPSACQLAQLATGLSPADMPAIRFSNARLSDEALLELHRSCHCFVTATRGEAWNLPAFDAMLVGRHIIAPLGQGSDDFLLETSAELYASRLSPAFGDVRIVERADTPAGYGAAQYIGGQGLTARSEWHDPDLSALGKMMRRAYEKRITDLEVINPAVHNPSERFGRTVVGAIIRTELET